MAKSPESKPAATLTEIKLKCFYSGFENEPGPGDIIAVDADEAARLIDLGAAEAVEAAAPENK